MKFDNQFIKKNRSILLKLIAFAILAVAGFIDIKENNYSFIQDPFPIGASIMVIACVMTLLNPGSYYLYPGMFIFVLTKVILLFTESKVYDIMGNKK